MSSVCLLSFSTRQFEYLFPPAIGSDISKDAWLKYGGGGADDKFRYHYEPDSVLKSLELEANSAVAESGQNC